MISCSIIIAEAGLYKTEESTTKKELCVKKNIEKNLKQDNRACLAWEKSFFLKLLIIFNDLLT